MNQSRMPNQDIAFLGRKNRSLKLELLAFSLKVLFESTYVRTIAFSYYSPVLKYVLPDPMMRFRLGTAYMMRRLAATPIANVRMVSNQPAGSTIGKEFYERVLWPAWKRLANRFKLLMDEGILRRADPWVAAEKRLLGAIPGPDPQEIARTSTLAADAFLKLYGPEKPARKAKAKA